MLIGFWSSAALSQTFTLAEEDFFLGTTDPVEVDWTFVTGGDITGFQVTITYDSDALTPDLDRCLEGASLDNQGCVLVQPGLIGLTFFRGQGLPNLSGTISFEVAGTVDEGDVFPLSLTQTDGVPEGITLTLENGSISVLGAPPAIAAISPLSWTASGVIDGTPPTQTFSVTNAAESGQTPPAANLQIQSIEIAGSTAFSLAGGGTCATTTSLAAGESCTVVVSLSTAAIGNFSAELLVGHSAGDNLIAALEGTIRDTDAELVIDPATFDFGELDIDAAPVCAAFEVSNTPGDDSLTVGTASVTGAPFSVTANTCNDATLAGGASCAVTVCFDPTEAEASSDSLTVTSNVNTATAALSGTGTAEPVIAITPPFGPVNLGTGLQGTTLTAQGSVVNTGSADGTVQCDLVENGEAARGDFIPASVFSTTLPLNQEITVPAGADPIPFSVSCALPADAEDGDVFTAQIQCDVNGEGVSDDTIHFLSCGVSEFEPLPVPTMQTWALILFALLMLLVGGISIRMFRV